jgi:hypothetical protein
LTISSNESITLRLKAHMVVTVPSGFRGVAPAAAFALLAFAHEQKTLREAQEKAAAEGKAQGANLSYDDWMREAIGE